MKKNMDKIVFESRAEVDEVAYALVTFLKEHPEARGKENVQQLAHLLDVMYMEW